MTPNQQKLDAYQTTNLECAAIVLENPAKYGAETALLVQWARLVHERAVDETNFESRKTI